MCKEYINEETFVSAMGQFFHTVFVLTFSNSKNHFHCFVCKESFMDNKFCKKEVYYDKEIKYRAFCSECIKFIKRIPCKRCNSVISGRVLDNSIYYT